MGRFWGLGNCIYPQFASVNSAVHKWVPILLGRYLRWTSVLSGRVSTAALRLLALIETRFKHWPSLAFMAYLSLGMNLPIYLHFSLEPILRNSEPVINSELIIKAYCLEDEFTPPPLGLNKVTSMERWPYYRVYCLWTGEKHLGLSMGDRIGEVTLLVR